MTGAGAINKLLGREVYTSNLQLGGTQIMYRNGVSHMTANDDFEGVSKIVDWMSFVPDKKNNPIPIALATDPWDRSIAYYPPPKQAYDVRWLIAGKEDDEGFLAGLFDKDSFQESLGGWARTVVVGRARLGGIPMGVIGVETRSVENITPADPANPDSVEQITNEAGGVWYPNSAFKTAQAINDFNHGEQLGEDSRADSETCTMKCSSMAHTLLTHWSSLSNQFLSTFHLLENFEEAHG